MRNPNRTLNRHKVIDNAWEKLRPQKEFSGLTLEKYRELARPALEIRAKMASVEGELRVLAAQRAQADAVLDAASLSVIHGVQGDPSEGDDGALYEAMGFVRRSRRARPKSRPAPANGAAKPPNGEVPS